MKIKTLAPLLLLAIGSSLPMAHGAILLGYDFNTNLSPSSNALNVSGLAFTVSGTNASVTQVVGPAAGNVTQGTVSNPGPTISEGTYTTTGSGVMNYNIGTTQNTTAAAANTNGFPNSTIYTTFTATAATGFDLDLNTLSFDWARGGTTNTRGLALFYSTDNFTSSSALLGTYSIGETTSLDYTRVTFDLSSIPVAQAVTFRFNGIGSNNQTGRYDNLILDGIVAVPEPSVSLLAALGLGSLALLRRRR